MNKPSFVSFNKQVKIDDLVLDLPVDNHKFDKFAVSVNNDGLIELWTETCIDVGIVYSKNCGFYVTADPRNYAWDTEIMVGHMDVSDPATESYRNCIWIFKRTHDYQIEFISKDCFTSKSGRVK